MKSVAKNTTPPHPPKRARLNALVMALALKVILSGRFTREELLHKTGVHYQSAGRWLAAIKREKLIYIADWQNDTMGRDNIPVYELGDKPDKKRRSITPAQRSKRYRDNLKFNQEK